MEAGQPLRAGRDEGGESEHAPTARAGGRRAASGLAASGGRTCRVQTGSARVGRRAVERQRRRLGTDDGSISVLLSHSPSARTIASTTSSCPSRGETKRNSHDSARPARSNIGPLMSDGQTTVVKMWRPRPAYLGDETSEGERRGVSRQGDRGRRGKGTHCERSSNWSDSWKARTAALVEQ